MKILANRYRPLKWVRTVRPQPPQDTFLPAGCPVGKPIELRPGRPLSPRPERYRRLADQLQTVLEGCERRCPPNWVALALKPVEQVQQVLTLLQQGMNLAQAFSLLCGPALADPQVLCRTALRVCQALFAPAPPCIELEKFLVEASQAIDHNLVARLESYLTWHLKRPRPELEDSPGLIRHLGGEPASLAGLIDGKARLEHATLNNLCVAAAVLYHQASCRQSARQALIERANHYLLYAEQKILLQPFYDRSPQLHPLFEMLTPFIQLPPDWSLYSRCRDVSDLNWCRWNDRWPAVQDYVRMCQQEPEKFWHTLTITG